ncbi:hypothetical protein L799_10040 [Enterobacter roggenkampii EC_38VIM1]|nr:hypothetical protein L799_10040 [Enterobacter roggenkampii EC_38VIM1]
MTDGRAITSVDLFFTELTDDSGIYNRRAKSKKEGKQGNVTH